MSKRDIVVRLKSPSDPRYAEYVSVDEITNENTKEVHFEISAEAMGKIMRDLMYYQDHYRTERINESRFRGISSPNTGRFDEGVFRSYIMRQAGMITNDRD